MTTLSNRIEQKGFSVKGQPPQPPPPSLSLMTNQPIVFVFKYSVVNVFLRLIFNVINVLLFNFFPVVPVIHVMTLLLPWLDSLQVDNRVYHCVQPPTKMARQSQRSLGPGSLGPTVDCPLMSRWSKIKQTERLCLIRQHLVDVSSLLLTDNWWSALKIQEL